MAKRIIIVCAVCGQEVSLEPSRAAVRKTCSRACQAKLLWQGRAIAPISTQRPDEERFWRNVDKTPGHGPNGDCWIWTASKTMWGYGNIMYKGVKTKTHICSYLMHKGDIPEGLCVLHKCDVRSCVRPEHLWLGTIAQNNADKIAKGRARNLVGSQHPSAKITEAQAVMILKDPREHKCIANDYGISRVLVSHIKNRRAWKHISS